MFLINFTREEQRVELTGSYNSLLDGSLRTGSLRMKPFDVEIIQPAQI